MLKKKCKEKKRENSRFYLLSIKGGLLKQGFHYDKIISIFIGLFEGRILWLGVIL